DCRIGVASRPPERRPGAPATAPSGLLTEGRPLAKQQPTAAALRTKLHAVASPRRRIVFTGRWIEMRAREYDSFGEATFSVELRRDEHGSRADGPLHRRRCSWRAVSAVGRRSPPAFGATTYQGKTGCRLRCVSFPMRPAATKPPGPSWSAFSSHARQT